MKFYDAGLTILITLLVVSAIGMASIKFWGIDNPVEEVAEEVIKIETGLDIDLSKQTKEK